MKVSPKKLLLAVALGLTVATVAQRAGGARAAQTVNLATPPGADRAEAGFAFRNGYAVQILESGGVPGAQVLFAPCTSTGTQYRCSLGDGTAVTLDGNGATNVNLNFNSYTQPIDAVIGTNLADANDQVIAIFNTANIPTAYALPGPLPYSAVVSTTSTATATTATQQSCFYLPLSGFAPSCFYGTIPGIGVGYVSPFSLGVVPGFNNGFLPGFGFFYVPFGTVTAGTGGIIFLQPTSSLLPAAVCPAGFHGNLTVVLGNAGFPFGTFFGFGGFVPVGAQTTTVVCP
ncbi:MAG TPA: hypothetical protein VFD32_15045 [Dehalococcoidia bacterium]|nr:hypothetical protein [Dehalococcoidia bacterium]